MEHRVIQYTLKGEFVKVWDNAYQASESGAESSAIINKQIKGGAVKRTPNFQWRYYTPDYPKNIGEYESAEHKKERPQDTIVEVNGMGEVIGKWNGTLEASKATGVSQSYICNILAGKVHHPKRRFKRL